MEILGIGASELVFILLIAIIVMGPKQMQTAGRTVAKWIRGVMTSEAWMATQQVSREARKQWTQFVREANEDLHTIDPLRAGAQGAKKSAPPNKPPRSVSTAVKPAMAGDGSGLPPVNQNENPVQPPAENRDPRGGDSTAEA